MAPTDWNPDCLETDFNVARVIDSRVFAFSARSNLNAFAGDNPAVTFLEIFPPLSVSGI